MARKNPRRNISRIDMYSASGTPHGGWEVRMQRRGRKYEKFFADGRHGGRRKALQAAKYYRDELEQRLKPWTVRELSRKPSARNTSGIVGVRKAYQVEESDDYVYTYTFWIAQWTDGKGKRKTRSFSVDKYGDEEAFRLAAQARSNGVNQAKRTIS
ncbi:MAG: AP2/ERF family transcription factor [Pirellulaceae bacterium]